jgi:SAM-dependent methyltransferase
VPPYPDDELSDAFEKIEEDFLEALDESLAPRGPGLLFDLVGTLGLPAGSAAIDVGCGAGTHAVELARRFGLRVTGVDPIAHHVEQCRQLLAEAASTDPPLAARVVFEIGRVEGLAHGDGAFDLVWCRDVLMYASDLGGAFAELRRVLRSGGSAVVYHSMLATARLTADEASMLGVDVTPAQLEATMAAAGFRVAQSVALGIEHAEYFEEAKGSKGRRLRHLARMLRAPERYAERFGQAAFDIMLADAYWHVYHMIGKLETMAYLLHTA